MLWWRLTWVSKGTEQIIKDSSAEAAGGQRWSPGRGGGVWSGEGEPAWQGVCGRGSPEGSSLRRHGLSVLCWSWIWQSCHSACPSDVGAFPGPPPGLAAEVEGKTQIFVLGRQGGSRFRVFISLPFDIKANRI